AGTPGRTESGMARDDQEHPSSEGFRFDDSFVEGAAYREPSAREREDRARAAEEAEKQARAESGREERRAGRKERYGKVRRLVPLLILVLVALLLTRLGPDDPEPAPQAPAGESSTP
ncbi:MAG: hypothetical protein ACRDKW_02070, partial [Actinomycetota bacterium]